MKTSGDGAIFVSLSDELNGPNVADRLNANTSETDRTIHSGSVSNDNSFMGLAKDAPFQVVSADGASSIEGTIGTSLKQGTLPGGNSAYPAGDSCVFSGSVYLS